MPITLKRLLGDLPELMLLRSRDGTIKPALIWLSEEGELDPGRYLRTDKTPTEIYRVVGDMPEPEPTFAEVMGASHLAEVAVRLSDWMRQHVAAVVEMALRRTDEILKTAKSYALSPRPEQIERLRIVALQALFSNALLRDRSGEQPDLTQDTEVWAYIEREIRNGLKSEQARDLRQLRISLDECSGRLRYACDHVQAMAELSLPISADRVASIPDDQTRQAVARLVDFARTAEQKLTQKGAPE